MSEAKTDIRATSYDAPTANPHGYSGTIDDALAQIGAEPNVRVPKGVARELLLSYLGIDKVRGGGADLSLDDSPRYGLDETETDRLPAGFYTLQRALDSWPQNFLTEQLVQRIERLSPSQLAVYRLSMEEHYTAAESVQRAEAHQAPSA